jgi:hypothetical protein
MALVGLMGISGSSSGALLLVRNHIMTIRLAHRLEGLIVADDGVATDTVCAGIRHVRGDSALKTDAVAPARHVIAPIFGPLPEGAAPPQPAED